MTEYEYEELMEFFRKKLKNHTETGLNSKRSEGYEMGVCACMSKLNDMHRDQKDQHE